MNEINVATIESRIYFIRNQKVMLDTDLAELYGVETKVLKQAVKRNLKRFPDDFMFSPTINELADLRSQFVTSNDPTYWNHTWVSPYLFTESGVAMLSSVLKSDRAIEINISIMRIFRMLRSYMVLDKNSEVDELKNNTNKMFQVVFERLDTIEETIQPKINPKRKKIGLND